ncbi:MAG: sensor histidine kinase N-terminal domain-containing protein [Rhodocyclaceae bacterium]|nr:sensor histidine kinase N-terminal domain-containing protein [Rhodocyclaceae bacterium]
MRAPSIRGRTTAMVVLVVAVLWLLAAYFTWREAEHEAAEVFDGHLAQAASMLIAQSAMEIEDDDDELGELHAPLTHRYARKVAFQLWDRGRVLLVHSENAPNQRLAAREEGFSDSVVDGVAWRVYSGWNAHREMLVQVGERLDARSDMADELAVGLLKPLLWTLPLLALSLWLAIGRAMCPLNTLARELAVRAPGRLEPVAGGPVPREVAPLVMRLNELLGRVDEALTMEQRFTGDAAHELRTPIAALCAQAEVALAAGGDEERRRALEAVLAAARRSARLVEQLLTLARADSLIERDWPAVDLAGIVRAVLAEIAAEPQAAAVEFEFEGGQGQMIRGEAGWLQVLVRNLVDNAVRHSPAGGLVRVVVAGAPPDAVELVVADQGPGVAPAQRSRLGERFWRGGATGGGSGLGLSIVKRIALLHHSEPQFGDGADGRGLAVRLRFGAASPGSAGSAPEKRSDARGDAA